MKRPATCQTARCKSALNAKDNTLRILCEAFQIEFQGRDRHCERLLVQEAFRVYRAGKMLVPIIDDARLMPSDCLRKLRLLCEDFPRTHNLVLIGQPPFLRALSLSVNEEIRSRVTPSAILPRLSPEVAEPFILDQLDQAGLGHNTFTQEAWPLSSVPARACCAAPAISASVHLARRCATRPASWTSNKSTACSSNP